MKLYQIAAVLCWTVAASLALVVVHSASADGPQWGGPDGNPGNGIAHSLCKALDSTNCTAYKTGICNEVQAGDLQVCSGTTQMQAVLVTLRPGGFGQCNAPGTNSGFTCQDYSYVSCAKYDLYTQYTFGVSCDNQYYRCSWWVIYSSSAGACLP